MQHSVKEIGKSYETLSTMRNDKIKFSAEDFFKFAKNNIKKYSIIENYDDLLVSTWHSDSLISDYRKSIGLK